MVTKRFPHSGTISYAAPGTTNSLGYLTEGTITSIAVICDIQMNDRQLKIVGDDGIVILYNYHVFCDPDIDFSSVPKAANFRFFSRDHVIRQLFEYQHHVEIKC